MPSNEPEDAKTLSDELKDLHRKLADADAGIGPSIGDKLRDQLYRRINDIEASLTPKQNTDFHGTPSSPWKGFNR